MAQQRHTILMSAFHKHHFVLLTVLVLFGSAILGGAGYGTG